MGHRNIPLSSRYSLSPKDLGPESWPSVRPDDLSTVVCFWNQRQSAAQKGLKASSLWMLKDWLIFSSLEHERSYPQILFSVEDPHVPLILCLGLESEEQVIWKLTRGWGYHQSRNKPETAKKKKKETVKGGSVVDGVPQSPSTGVGWGAIVHCLRNAPSAGFGGF